MWMQGGWQILIKRKNPVKTAADFLPAQKPNPAQYTASDPALMKGLSDIAAFRLHGRCPFGNQLKKRDVL
ncbi:MAG: hypothetical protein CSA22_07795 [Deltaproteobacteria bacterium]|nr:MAG: hypothetical protein CSA22_07795 [Deltaproteobacteria bacterium]